ncbi:hypothetical protein [Pyrobaculum aerophilum]|uniref:hypothetical protein n=1 Tax=Pyrobaculum aerophilum TaxID=13773 RepID=UPI0023F4AFEB|nr:hypothetical protein [Pyrobaculum aerophilum]MCX8137394.1 hypothetical protein [Pyrobaculum aerophilum]
MFKRILLVGVAVAVLLVLLALFSQGPGHYEANYTLTLVFTSPGGSQRMDLGWILLGTGSENYTMAVIRFSGAEIQVFYATEKDKEYAAVCIAGYCARDAPLQREMDLRFKVRKMDVVGKCRHLGYEGEIVRLEGEYDLGLLSAIAKSQGVTLNATGEGEACFVGNLLLWAREKYIFTVNEEKASIEFMINATRVGSYSAERYREVLNKAKSS